MFAFGQGISEPSGKLAKCRWEPGSTCCTSVSVHVVTLFLLLMFLQPPLNLQRLTCLSLSCVPGTYSAWTAHLDTQSLQAGVHYMLCVDLDGVPWTADSGSAMTLHFTVFFSVTLLQIKDNVTLPGGPTGFDVFVSPVVESWQFNPFQLDAD